GRARQPGTGGEVLAPVDGGVDPTAFRVEADAAPTGRDGRWVRLQGFRGELRTSDRPDAGHPEVDPLDLLVRIALEVVPVQRAVLVVEATGHRVDDVLGDRALRHGDTDLEGLPEVAQVGRADLLVDIGV